jgi:thiol-disulfide isomerase/thioredoxin
MKTNIFLLVLGLAGGVLLGLIIFWSGNIDSTAQGRAQFPTRGKPAPDFQANIFNGGVFQLKEIIQKPIIINFWATWCQPCKNEMSLLQEFSNSHFNKLTIIGINESDSTASVQQFIRDNSISFRIVLDPEGTIEKKYQVIALPTTFFIDSNGILQAEHIGELNKDLIQKYFELLGTN